MNILFWVIGALLVGFGLFMNYTNWRVWSESKKSKEQFLKNHQDSKSITIGKYRPWLFLLMVGACVGFGIVIMTSGSSLSDDSRYSQALVYLGLAIFGLAMYAEALTDSKVVYCPDGFQFETEYIRYKNIRHIQIGKGFFKGCMIMMNANKEIPVSKSIAQFAQEQYDLWQKTRKEQRKTRRERRVR